MIGTLWKKVLQKISTFLQDSELNSSTVWVQGDSEYDTKRKILNALNAGALG